MPPEETTTGEPTDTNTSDTEESKEKETNTKDKVEDLTKLWDNKPADEEKPTPETTVAAPTVEQQKPDEAFDEHIKTLKLADGVDTAKIVADMAQGNTDSLKDAFNSVAGAAYKASMINANKLIEAKVNAAIKEAVGQSEGKFKTDVAIRDLNVALPFTKAPEIAPIAKVVFGQFMKKGQSVEEAIESVRLFFAHTTKLSAKDVGMQVAKKGDSFSSSHSGITPEDSDESEDLDFEAILSGLSK